MPGALSSRTISAMYAPQAPRRRSEAKRSRIIEFATKHFAEHGYDAVRMGDIATALGIAKGSIFQHFGSKDGLFLEVYKRAARTLPKYLDAPAEIRQAGFFELLRHWMLRTDHLLRDNWVLYRIAVLGNYGTDLALKREINRFLVSEDPYGTLHFVRFGLERQELRKDIEVEMIVSMLNWTMECFQDAFLNFELSAGSFRRSGEANQKTDVRVEQFLAVLQRAIGTQNHSVPIERPTTHKARKNVAYD